MPIVVSDKIREGLELVASKHCVKRGLNEIEILDSNVVGSTGFYTVKGTEVHATKVFSDGSFYCSCQGIRFHHMIDNRRLCSHLVAALADMSNHGVDVKPILESIALGV